MDDVLKSKQVAILATDGYEHSELVEPKAALEKAGATVHVVSLEHGTTPKDRLVDDVRMSDYDALVLPGGVINPDMLRHDMGAVELVRGFFAAKRPVAAICHGPWLLAEAGVLNGRTVTSFESSLASSRRRCMIRRVPPCARASAPSTRNSATSSIPSPFPRWW